MSQIWLMVGLPGAGKTTQARALCRQHRAVLYSPDEWMLALYGHQNPPRQRDLLEGRMISSALEQVQLGIASVLDFGFWTRDERYCVTALARQVGASAAVVCCPVTRDVQRSRINRRWSDAPSETFPMTEQDIAAGWDHFEAPAAAELVSCVVGSFD